MKGLKRVLIQGKPYAVLFDMYGLARIMEEADCSFGDLMEKAGRMADFRNMKGEDLRFIYDVVYAGFANGAEEEQKEFPHTKRELSRMVPLISEPMTEIMQEFQRGMNSNISASEPEESQKKEAPKPKKKQPKPA